MKKCCNCKVSLAGKSPHFTSHEVRAGREERSRKTDAEGRTYRNSPTR